MIKKQLYRIMRADGGRTVTPNRPTGAGYEVAGWRLIAGEGKDITDNGVDRYEVIDVPDDNGYYEIDKIVEESEEIENG